eukprot:TRINITY_DN6946_c0_g1_i3.p2 TRINITY_DN6946_c0_g1~~TRINITY_DN6946_c0_g1_i3.p2  ORF type:complete len:218 (-),score=-13.26 TRINITY_DN6946_c0_g1_i3:474-1127(-)
MSRCIFVCVLFLTSTSTNSIKQQIILFQKLSKQKYYACYYYANFQIRPFKNKKILFILLQLVQKVTAEGGSTTFFKIIFQSKFIFKVRQLAQRVNVVIIFLNYVLVKVIPEFTRYFTFYIILIPSLVPGYFITQFFFSFQFILLESTVVCVCDFHLFFFVCIIYVLIIKSMGNLGTNCDFNFVYVVGSQKYLTQQNMKNRSQSLQLGQLVQKQLIFE